MKYCCFTKDVSKDNKIIFHKNSFIPVAYEDSKRYYFKLGTLKNKDGTNKIDFGISKEYEGDLFFVHEENT